MPKDGAEALKASGLPAFRAAMAARVRPEHVAAELRHVPPGDTP